MSQSKTSVERAAAIDRQTQALKLRGEGRSYERIGEALGVNTTTAWRLVQRAYNRSLKINDAEAEFQRNLDLGRCDVSIDALWPAVLAGKTRAIEVLMVVLKRRADLLGLDAPAKIDITQHLRAVAEEAGIDPDEAVKEAMSIVASRR